MGARSMRQRRVFGGLAAALLLTTGLAACGDTDETEVAGEAEVGNETLATALAAEDDLDVLNTAMSETGLGQVFDGSAAYTVLAPNDAAFEKATLNAEMEGDERNALLAAILRDHIIPGAVTPDDISTAIKAQQGDIKMTTMGSGELTFSQNDAGTLMVTDAEGHSATLTGAPILATNGVAIPIDTVLRQP